MMFFTFTTFFFSLLIAENNYCTVPNLDNHPNISSNRSLYDIGDTISVVDQELPFGVCHGNENYEMGSIFRFSELT